MSGIAGLRGTGDWGTDERPKSFREKILQVNPNGTAPIFALTGRAKKRTVDDPEFSWWDEPNGLVRLQVAGAHASGDTTITVDSSDPAAATLNSAYGTATHLKPGDLLLVEPSADNATFDHEVIKVESVLSDTQFTVSRAQQGTSAASIGNDAFLLLIGSSYAEGTSAPTATSRNPVKYYNLTQIFKNTYELTKTADVTKARTGDAWSNDKRRKMFDHSRDIEMSMLFGRRSETTGDNGKPLRTMNGLRNTVGNVTVFGAAVTAASFMDAVSPVFDYDTPAGDSRMVFAGNAAIIEMSKVIQAETGISMEIGPVVKVFGMNFREWVTPRGSLLVKSHPLMNLHSLYKNSMFVLDFASIEYVTLPGRDTKSFDDVQAKDEDVRRGYVQTECSLQVDRGGLTMAYLGNISAT